MMKMNSLKKVLPKLQLCFGTITAVFFYLAKYRKNTFFQLPCLLCGLVFSFLYFLDSLKLSDEDEYELKPYHIIRSGGLLIVLVCFLLLKLFFTISFF